MKALAATTVALLLACSVVQVASRSTGAPSEACSTFTQQHSGISPQSSQIPYTIDFSVFDDGTGSFVYQPGNTYQLTLSAPSQQFRGFLIQGEVVADSSPAGTFSNPPSQARLSSCSPSNIAITHEYSGPGAAVDRDSVTVTWTAPSAGSGPIRFRYAVTQAFITFWANARTGMIDEAVSPPPPASSTPVQPQPTQTTTSTTVSQAVSPPPPASSTPVQPQPTQTTTSTTVSQGQVSVQPSSTVGPMATESQGPGPTETPGGTMATESQGPEPTETPDGTMATTTDHATATAAASTKLFVEAAVQEYMLLTIFLMQLSLLLLTVAAGTSHGSLHDVKTL